MAVLKNGPAASQVLLPRGVDAGAAQVDQVEVRLVQSGAAQVGAAQVRLADLLRRLVVLLLEVVGVEARLAALAGDRTEDQSAAARPHVKAGSAQVRVAETRSLPVDVGESRLLQARSLEIGFRHVR